MRKIFDFNHWCSWAETRCRQVSTNQLVVKFSLGKPSPKPGTQISFETDRKLMALNFWTTGVADFHGIELPSRQDKIIFVGRLLDDTSFENTLGECLAFMTE